MKRFGQVIGIKPEHIDAYEKLHAETWEGVLKTIENCNIRNYSIYRYNNLLFSYFEYHGDDFDADMAKMAQDETTQKWWAICEPMQNPVDDREEGEWWKKLKEVFHTD